MAIHPSRQAVTGQLPCGAWDVWPPARRAGCSGQSGQRRRQCFNNIGGVFGVAIVTAVFGQWPPPPPGTGPAPHRHARLRRPGRLGLALPAGRGRPGHRGPAWQLFAALEPGWEIHRSSGSAPRQATASTTRLPSISAVRVRVVIAVGDGLMAVVIARPRVLRLAVWPPGGAVVGRRGLSGSARDIRSHYVCSVPVQAAPGPVVPDRGAWVCMGGGFVHVAPAGPRHPARR